MEREKPTAKLSDFLRVFLGPFLINKVLLFYFGIMYSNNPGEGYGYGVLACIFFLAVSVGRFLWIYRDVDDP